MAKKTVKENPVVEEQVEATPAVEEAVETPVVEEAEATPAVAVENPVVAVEEPATATSQKYDIGAIVFITNDASADLNGFKLFAQYKKYTYTVESYDAETDVYTLRRLNLKLKLNSQYLVAPSERAHDPINRKQY